MAVISKDLGAVTAYAAAVNRGYTGTKEEFETLMASYATVAQQAAQSAGNASQSATDASQSATDAETAKGTAQQAATDAQTAQASAQGYAQSAQQSAQSASQSATDAESAKDTAVNAVDGFDSHAQQALDSVNSAGINWKSLAQAKALDSEAYALGTRDGEDVGSSDPAYHNNAKYYAQQGSASAQTASNAAQTATTKAGEAQASAEAAAESARTLTIDNTLTQRGQAADAKVVGDEIADLKEDLNELDSNIYNGIYNGYKYVLIDWEHGWVDSSGKYNPNRDRYLIKGRSTADDPVVVNGSSNVVYIVYFSEYTDLRNYTYDSYAVVNVGATRSIDKTKPYFLIESETTTESGLDGIQLRTDTPIAYLSKATMDSKMQENQSNLAHKQSIFFAYCSQIFWTITGIECALSVNSDIRVRFDVHSAAVDTTKEQLLAIAQASTAQITVSDGVISGVSFAIVFNFGTNAIEVVNPAVRSTYVNTAILFYWHYGVIGGILVNNKTALKVDQNASDIVDIKSRLDDALADYFVTEAETCRNSLIADCGEKALVIAFSTDNHYGASNGMNFPTTVKTIKKVNDMYQFDLVVDGGDLINGDKPKAEAINLLTDAVNDLIEIGRPAYTLLGNHDDDSFTATEQPLFSKAELYAMMYRHSGVNMDYVAETEQYGYKDLDQYGLRVIFLDAVHGVNGHVSSNWGYSDAELAWFTSDALNTSKQIVMFSHMAFTAAYTAYGTSIKNGVAMRTAVENFIANGGVVVGLFHGHNHWDYIGQHSQTNGFHEVSTGCSRIISGPTIPYAHPEGAVMPERIADTVTQELWDIIIIKPESRTVNMIRYGAGSDRTFTY